jgi:hypothetical protein
MQDSPGERSVINQSINQPQLAVANNSMVNNNMVNNSMVNNSSVHTLIGYKYITTLWYLSLHHIASDHIATLFHAIQKAARLDRAISVRGKCARKQSRSRLMRRGH